MFSVGHHITVGELRQGANRFGAFFCAAQAAWDAEDSSFDFLPAHRGITCAQGRENVVAQHARGEAATMGDLARFLDGYRSSHKMSASDQ